jgi:uncharacterized membrane protein YgcG
MFFCRIFRFLLIFFTFGTWGTVLAAPLSLHDENRILNSSQIYYLETLAQELNKATGFSLSVILLDKTSPNTDISPEDGQILLVTFFRQQRNLVKTGKMVEPFLPEERVDKLQREFLFPEYKAGRYDRGTVSLAYHAVQEIMQKKGGTLTLPPPESTLENHIGAAGWIFILLIFVLLALTLFKRKKKGPRTELCRDFRYGRFGWRLGQ